MYSVSRVGCYKISHHGSTGFLKILKLLIRKCGRELAEKQDNHQTKPVYFAAQEGEQHMLKYSDVILALIF